MDHRGLRARLTGAGCTPCGAAVPVDRISILADRGDIAFVELDCQACGSRTMCVVVAAEHGRARLDPDAHPEPDPAAEARLAGAPPLRETDVTEMSRFLAGWSGDLHSLVGDGPGPDGPRAPGRRR